MSEYELVSYNETLSDLISSVLEHGSSKVAEDLVNSFKPESTDLAFKILECAKKKQVAALFQPPK